MKNKKDREERKDINRKDCMAKKKDLIDIDGRILKRGFNLIVGKLKLFH